MKLMVSGGAGYVGSVCAKVLLERGHEVVVVDDLSTGNADAVPEGAQFVEDDVVAAARRLLPGGSFDGVLHFAAKSLVGESVEIPEKYWYGNVVTTLDLLEVMRRVGTRRLVFSSTAATYGEPESVPITEEAPTRPTNPYGATKLAIDHAITSYAVAHGNRRNRLLRLGVHPRPGLGDRPGSVYSAGPGLYSAGPGPMLRAGRVRMSCTYSAGAPATSAASAITPR